MTYEELLNLPFFTADDLKLRTKDGSSVPQNLIDAIDAYGKRFASPQRTCIGCGEILLDDFGLGCFEWGICTGRGQCKRCGYPYQAQHSIPPHITFMELILPYHPTLLADMNQLRDRLAELGIDEPNMPSTWAKIAGAGI